MCIDGIMYITGKPVRWNPGQIWSNETTSKNRESLRSHRAREELCYTYSLYKKDNFNADDVYLKIDL
jgi:hypothetical protein